MAWFSGKVSLGNFPDLAGAVNKLSESVKSIEKNFDSVLGFEEKPADAGSPDPGSSEDPEVLQKGGEAGVEPLEKLHSSVSSPSFAEKERFENDSLSDSSTKQTLQFEEGNEEKLETDMHPNIVNETKLTLTAETDTNAIDHGEIEANLQELPSELSKPSIELVEQSESSLHHQGQESSEIVSPDMSAKAKLSDPVDQVEGSAIVPNDAHSHADMQKSTAELKTEDQENMDKVSFVEAEDNSREGQDRININNPNSSSAASEGSGEKYSEGQSCDVRNSEEVSEVLSNSSLHENMAISETDEVNKQGGDYATDSTEEHPSLGINSYEIADSTVKLEKVKREMKVMEAALHGAARQAQVKADEIAKLMNENEQLKAVIEHLQRKSNQSEVESLREEYHQRVAVLERKVYALTKERDTLRREQSKKSDATALLKEKDEIINQVMAEGEELSKKQAAQESQIRKLRVQIRELEEEKKRLITKLQVEENKVESIKRDKAATEKLLQETTEKNQAELTTQKEYYTNALCAAKEAEAIAEAKANNEARTELENHLREAEEREAMLVQALEELRQTLSRKEQEAVFREDMLRGDIDDLHKRHQASERRCEELITQIPESTRPLLRQIEAMQENSARRAEAWAAVERSLNLRFQEAEAKAAAAEEKERSVNECLSQTLSRINVLEAQISCLRAEHTQLTRSLEKERQRAAESRQEYLALKEEADTQEGRVNQLEGEIRELRRKHKQELQEALTCQEHLQQEIDREKAAHLELETTARLQSSTAENGSVMKNKSGFENGNLTRRLSSSSSMSSMAESYFLQVSLDQSDSHTEQRSHSGTPMCPYYMKGMTPSAFEATLRQKEGELASYVSRLASMESIRDSLAEELVKITAQFEKLRSEVAVLPGIRAELEALRRRHSAALELMGERDEELEELRADITDLKEMYREQVNLLVNKINVMSSSIGAS